MVRTKGSRRHVVVLTIGQLFFLVGSIMSRQGRINSWNMTVEYADQLRTAGIVLLVISAVFNAIWLWKIGRRRFS